MQWGKIPPNLFTLKLNTLKPVELVKPQTKLKSLIPPSPRLLAARINSPISNLLFTLKIVRSSLHKLCKEGTFPCSWFSEIARWTRFEALDIEPGIDPENWLALRPKYSRLGKAIPKFAGKVPWSLFIDTEKRLKEERLKMEGGIIPDKLFPSKAR